MIFSALSFTAMNSVIKYLDNFHTFEVVFFRSLGTLIICYVLLKHKGISLWGNQKKLLIGRSVVGVISMTLFFYALKIMPFGSTVTLRYLAPVFAAIFAVIILKEKIKSIQWAYILMAFIGVLLLKGFETEVNAFGLVIILTSALFSGFVYIFLRAIGQRDHPLVIIFYFMLISTILGGLGSLFYWRHPSVNELILLISSGVFGYGGQIFMTKAFQLETANKVAPLTYLEAVFALYLGWLFFAETYTIWGLVGIFMVVVGMLLNMIVKPVKTI